MARGILQIGGTGIDTDGLTATPERVLNGDTYIGVGSDDPQTGAIPIKTAESYMPGTSNIVLPPGQYLGGEQTIFGDSGFVSENIKKGSIIWGKTGTFEGFVPGPTDIYNRGTWAEGFSNNTVGKVPFTTPNYYDSYTISYEKSSIKISAQDSKGIPGIATRQVIDFSPYKTLNIVYSINKSDRVMHFYLYQGITSCLINPNAAIANTHASRPSPNIENTLSLNVSGINLSGTFSFFDSDSSGGLRIINIHKIYFTI